jgi:glutamyl-tRNA synthetase
MSTDPQAPVRVRFAPSPTGYLHVGGARTAIYNWLLRQRFGGDLILRIEDTDRARSDQAMTRQIQDALKWLGVSWDEGPFLQSERVAGHLKRAQQLIESGHAYHCFCSSETLEQQRKEAQAKGEGFLYPRTCMELATEEVEQRIAQGRPHIVRFVMPRENTQFDDLIRGDMDVPSDALDDFIIVRSDGSPTYHLSVVCDDIDMGVTHVLRGEDHLSNTPKHVRLFEALGVPVPVFGHLPLMLGADRKRLSKRFGATSVEEFREQGILPQALFNYLALLSWTPPGEEEILSASEMVKVFSLDKMGASAAVFDVDKLKWVNGKYLSTLPLDELLHHLRPFLDAEDLGGADEERLRAAIDLHRTRPRTLADLAASVKPYFVDTLKYDDELCLKFLDQPDLPGWLGALKGRFAQASWDEAGLEEALRALATEKEIAAGKLIHPARMAVTAAKAGPGIFEVLEAMGKEATFRHLNNFMAYLRAGSA